MNILTVNAGSSSIKLVLFAVRSDDGPPERRLEASIINIGQSVAALRTREFPEAEQSRPLEVADQSSATTTLLGWLADKMPGQEGLVISHRIVHGGPAYSQPRMISEEMEEDLRRLTDLDPEHAPASLRLIGDLRQYFPGTPQVACFDTAFFRDLPRLARTLPLPRKFAAQGLRRYGFHGLSYDYLLSAFGQAAGPAAAKGRVIFAHLGSGASLAATKNGEPVDTTMSFTPASGLLMSSRSGDLDPGIAWYLNQQAGMSLEEYNHMVNFESGLLGVSGLSADMLTLLRSEATDEHAAEAVDLFCYQVKKSIGALAATLDGLDSLIFSGGIGEEAPVIRERICEGLGFLGVELDRAANDGQDALISAPHGKVGVHVIPTDESLVMARQAIDVVRKSPAGEPISYGHD